MATVDKSRLEAINKILTGIGEGAVSQAGETVAATEAERILDDVSEEVQSVGWHFNTEIEVELTPDMNDEIIVPADALVIDAHDPSKNVTFKEGKLFNLDDNDFEFTSPIDVDIVRFLDIPDLPPTARNYIVAKATKRFQDRFLGSRDLALRLQQDENEAYAALHKREAQVGEFTALDPQGAAFRGIFRRGNALTAGD